MLPLVACIAAESSRPNIILVLADDLGYGDVTPQRMPFCSQLAQRGMRLDLYAHQNCMPTRTALFTGRYPHRYGLHSVWPTPIEPGLPTNEKILSEHLRDAGYVCGMFGKWHLGWKDRFQWPTRRGFQEFIGFLGGHLGSYGTRQSGLPYADGTIGHDHNKIHDLQWNEVPLYTSEYSTSLFRDAAMRFLEKHSNKPQPFFLYLPFNAPHGPFAAPRQYVETVLAPGGFDPALMNSMETHADDVLCAAAGDEQANHATAKLMYAAMILAVDDAVKAIYTKLEALGIEDNTLFIFASDNGVSYTKGVPVGSSYPLRGQKGSPYEGGSRVANFVVWPGRVSPGQKISSTVWIGDLAPTFLEIAGAALPSNFDGASILSAIQSNAPIMRPFGARRIMPMLTKTRYVDKTRPEIAKFGRATIVTLWRKYIRTIYWDARGQRLPFVDEELYHLGLDIGETNNLINTPADQRFADLSRQEFKNYGGDQLLEKLPDIPSDGEWVGFVPTIDFGIPDGTATLETTLTP